MTTANNNHPSQDDRVLEQLYKEGAKDEPPAKLNDEIINYAANASKSDAKNSQVGSHFGGGWKVPLSMAASVVVVFALLVQLEQSPQQLELPPIPEIPIPAESKDSLFKSNTSPAEKYEEESKTKGSLNIERETNELSAPSASSIDLKGNQKHPSSRDRLILEDTLDNASRVDEYRKEDDSHPDLSTTPSITTRESTSMESPAAASKPATIKKQMQKSDHDALTSHPKTVPNKSIQQRATAHEPAMQSMDNAGATSDITPEIAEESEQAYAPIPVEDWLLMIERLVARKDYAEAARQLEKFKDAHPKVNVEDLDAKIP